MSSILPFYTMSQTETLLTVCRLREWDCMKGRYAVRPDSQTPFRLTLEGVETGGLFW